METSHLRPDEQFNSQIPQQEELSEEELLLLELEMMRPDNPDDGDTGYDITVFETTARPEEEIAQPKLDKKNPALDVTVFNTRYPDGSVSGDLD